MVGQELIITSVFMAGILSFFAPCIIPVLPVYLSILTGNSTESNEKTNSNVLRKWYKVHPITIVRTLLFLSGISVTFLLLGYGAGILGSFLYERWFMILCGSLVILLGLHQLGVIRLQFLNRERKLHLKRSTGMDLTSVFLLGLTFSFGWTPCIGPILGAVLALIAGQEEAFQGTALMLVYVGGLSIPFILLAIFSEWFLKIMGHMKHGVRFLKQLGGVLIIVMGILLMTDQLNKITTWL